MSLPELSAGEVSRRKAGRSVHTLAEVCRKHANGVFTCGRSATQKAATESVGPESRNFRLLRKHS